MEAKQHFGSAFYVDGFGFFPNRKTASSGIDLILFTIVSNVLIHPLSNIFCVFLHAKSFQLKDYCKVHIIGEGNLSDHLLDLLNTFHFHPDTSEASC